MMGNKSRLADVLLIHFYLPVAWIGIECEKYRYFPKKINALIYYIDGVFISFSYCVQATRVDTEPEAFVFPRYKYDRMCPLSFARFGYADLDYLFNLLLF